MQKKKKILIGIGLILLLLCVASGAWVARSVYCGFYERCPVSTSREEDGIRLTLWSRRKWYEAGETVYIRVIVENVSNQTITLVRPGKEPVFDIEYRDESGEYVKWSQKNPTLATSNLTLKPGEKFETKLMYIPAEYAPYSYTASFWARQGTVEWSQSLSTGYGGYRY